MPFEGRTIALDELVEVLETVVVDWVEESVVDPVVALDVTLVDPEDDAEGVLVGTGVAVACWVAVVTAADAECKASLLL